MKTGARGGTWNILAESQVERIDKAARSLLMDPGIVSESELFLDLFAANGAHVDRPTRVIRVPSDIIDAALKTVPRSFVLHGRNDDSASLLVESGRVYYGMGGTAEPRYFDCATMRARAPTKDDMIANTRVGHACRHIDFVQTLCMSADYPAAHTFFHDYDALYRNTTKPTVLSVLDRPFTQLALGMAQAAVGGAEAFRARPHCLAMVTPVSPLKVGVMNEGLFDAVAAGAPLMYAPGPMMGASGPATVAGTLALSIAEALFGLAAVQMLKPGHPVVLKPDTDVCDMRTMLCTYGSPEQTAGKAAAAQMARHYRVPLYGLGGGVEAKAPDSEAAAEAALNMLANGLAGTTLSQALGTMCFGMYGCREQAIICDEIAAMVKRVLAGIEITDETLALDVIRQAGHGGNFLQSLHTAQHYAAEMFFPGLFERRTYDQWVAEGALLSHDLARRRADEILATAGEVPLAPGAGPALADALEHAIRETDRRSAA